LRLAYNTTGFDLPERRMISAVPPQPTIFSASGAAPTPLDHEYQEHFGLTAFMITIILRPMCCAYFWRFVWPTSQSSVGCGKTQSDCCRSLFAASSLEFR
jgi:hypothetical protein